MLVVFLGTTGGILTVAAILIFAGVFAIRQIGPVLSGFVGVAAAVLIVGACIVKSIQDMQRALSPNPAPKPDPHARRDPMRGALDGS